MSKDISFGSGVELSHGQGSPTAPAQAPIESAEGVTRELWRVVSVDGSTRVFQTKPGVDPNSRRGKSRRVSACALDNDASATTLFDRGASALPALVTESGAPTSAAPADELSLELTSVTQAWPSLSPGIRGAVMALIRAASTARPTRPAAAPRRE